MADNSLPLAGVRIVETIDPQKGMSTRYLADLGADVIVVSDGRARTQPPSIRGQAQTALAQANKSSVVIDPFDSAERETFLRLLCTADVWVSDHTAEELTELGIDDIRARLPRLIVVSVTNFGLLSSMRTYRSTESTLAAMAAILCRSGNAGRDPLLPPERILDAAIAAQISWVILLAHWHLQRMGVGDHLDVSLLDTATQVLDPAFGAGPTAGYGRRWSDYPAGRPNAAAYYPVFDCADGQVRIVVLAASQWQALWHWLGEPEEFADPRFDLVTERQAAHPQLAPLISALFADRSAMDIAIEGQRRGIPIAPVLALGELTSVDHFVQRGAFTTLAITPTVTAPVPSGYVEIDGRRAGIRRAAPLVGQDDHLLASLPEIGSVATNSAPIPPAAATAPFAGIRVVDLGIIVAGAETGRMFADYGADVIKVENREHPDGSRAPFDGSVSAGFARGHRNKRSLDVNLRTKRGQQLLADLLADADVLLSNFKPSTLDKLGFTNERLMEINPRLVVVRSSAMGDTGPWKTWMGYGPLVRAVAGLTSLWQYPDAPGEVADGMTIYPDHVAGRIVATAALAGLTQRQRTGRGCQVSCAQSEIILTALGADIVAESLHPNSVTPHGNKVGEDAPGGVFACTGRDQWCVVSVVGDQEYRQLSEVIDLPEVASASERRARRAEIEAAVAAWTSSRSGDEVMTQLQRVGVAAAPMRRVPELGVEPALRERRLFTALYQPTITEPVVAERRQFHSTYIPDALGDAAPVQGQHTRSVCVEVLGLDESEVDALISQRVLYEPDVWSVVRSIRDDDEQ